MEVITRGTDLTPELGAFIDQFRTNNSYLETVVVGDYSAFGRNDPTRRKLALRGKEIDLSPILFRTTAIVVEAVNVRRSGAYSVAVLTIKLP